MLSPSLTLNVISIGQIGLERSDQFFIGAQQQDDGTFTLNSLPINNYTFPSFTFSPGITFTNILRAAFANKSVLCSFSVLVFVFESFWQKEIGKKIAHKMLVKLALDWNEWSHLQCLKAEMNFSTDKLDLFRSNCDEKYATVCQKLIFAPPNCSQSSPIYFQNSLVTMIGQEQDHTMQLANIYIKAEIKDMMQRLNQIATFQSIFSTVWYSSLPCFDIRNITALSNGDSSLLRYCEWKGKPISCSAIFSTVPTDQGMCCSFNMKAANEIYVESEFRDLLIEMQQSNKVASFLPSAIPKSYMQGGEPKIIPGRNKGLVLLLDAHSDWLTPGSAEGDFNEFTAFIDSSGSFPLMNQEGIQIKPGFNNVISLISSRVKADPSLAGLDKDIRNCLFPEENSGLKIYRKYSYLNCKFECGISYAQDILLEKYNNTCLPWYFPTPNEPTNICDPWESFDFFQIMIDQIPDNQCPQCLADCSVTFYEPTITVQPFDSCDASNLGVSQFCNFDFKKQLPMQDKLVTQMQNEFVNSNNGNITNLPNYIKSLKSSKRKNRLNLFKNTKKFYDAFDKDIAMVEIIYQKSTAIQIESRQTMTWIDYFAAVGGLLGLVLGMGFVSFFELFWLFIRIFSIY